jgi:sporulation protein YlmC with PRC-barrel domain
MATGIITRAAVLRTRDFLGRDVLDAGGNKIGAVKDLLLDRQTGEVRYLEVNLGVFRKQIIVPVRHVDWGEDSFVLRGWSGEQVGRLPAYDPEGPLTGDTLDELVWAYPAFYGSDADRDIGTAPGDPQILPMSEAKDFKVRREEPDLRGWNVFGADGERVGKVADLLVDPASMKVAYLDVDLHDDLFRLKDDRHVLIPTDAVDLRQRGQDVWVRNVDAARISHLPAYSGGQVDPLIMRHVSDAFRDAPVLSPGERPSSRHEIDEDRRLVADHPAPEIIEDDARYIGENDTRPIGDPDIRFDDRPRH